MAPIQRSETGSQQSQWQNTPSRPESDISRRNTRDPLGEIEARLGITPRSSVSSPASSSVKNMPVQSLQHRDPIIALSSNLPPKAEHFVIKLYAAGKAIHQLHVDHKQLKAAYKLDIKEKSEDFSHTRKVITNALERELGSAADYKSTEELLQKAPLAGLVRTLVGEENFKYGVIDLGAAYREVSRSAERGYYDPRQDTHEYQWISLQKRWATGFVELLSDMKNSLDSIFIGQR
ncbi:MAG: hypothetical protein KDD60_08090 [Bdellovibrionales bacterium]|nr:hypothetical protein [Bdellovibrionales bacterium]